MSVIESLSIQGVRSFGTKAEDKQIITFSSPSTLILGANGCGKTTIIECLKYALTGELPPGSNRGQSFIHDPKIYDFTECLGQVKLVVRNIKGEKMTVTRSMKLSNKRGKPSFENLDATITFEGEDQKSISKRCIDVDTEMCHFMGVSKAIINNVIFCHQEDSSWPLDEAKKLKEKFDAIFGTTEYNKAIEKIIKMRKVEMENLKLKECDLKLMNHIKKEAEDKNLDLQNAKQKLQDLDEILIKSEEEIKPIQTRLETIFKIEMEVSKLESQKIKLATSLKNCKEQITAISSKIKNIFNGDKFDLDKEIRNFRETMNEKETQLRNLNEKLQSIKLLERKIQNNITELDRKRTTLIHQRQQEQEYIADRGSKIHELCEQLKISIPSNIEELSQNDINKILNNIKNAFENEERKIIEFKENFNKMDQSRQIEIDKLREQKASTESAIQSKKSIKTQLNCDLKNIQNQITNVETSALKLKKITEEIEKLNETYGRYCESIDLDGLKEQLSEKRINVNKLQENLDRLDEELTFLNSFTKLTQEINLKEKELDKREHEMKRIKSKHSDNLKVIFSADRKVEMNFKRNIQMVQEDLQKQLKQLNDDMNKLRLKQRELEMMRKSKKDEILKFENEIESCKDKIFDKCHNINQYDELLERCKENIAKLQLDYGALKSSEAMYKRYINKIEEDPCCPLCHRDMTTNQASDITNELLDEIHRLPENINRTEKQLKNDQIKYEELLNLKPLIEKVQQFEIDIPKCKENLHKIENDLSKVANDVESYQMLTAEPTSKLNLINSMLGDMSLLDEALKDIGRLKNEITALKSKLPERNLSNGNSSIEDVQLQKSTISAELKNERSEIDRLQTKYDKESEILNKIREARNTKKDEQIRLQEGVQALSQLKTRREEINKQVESVSKEIKGLEDKLEPLKDQLNIKVKEKERLKNEHLRNVEQMSTRLNSLKKIDYEIQRYTKELKQLADLNLSNELEKLKVELKHYMDEQTAKAKQNSDLTASIEQVKDEILKQEILERELMDNKELMNLQEKATTLQEQYDLLNKDVGDLDYRSVSREKEQLNKKREMITVKRGEILGQKGEINNTINKLTKELNDAKFKDSIMNYRKIYYEVEILKKIIADLGQYRIALEWGLMKFHAEKMEKINRLIRELWRQIYRGNDIDYIQIQTDEMKTDSADRKRSYNYRVIQCKNGSEIDMRGRCSAGQRVLASLIIRMALAETFSSNCGILALDEPTTNLDRLNIISLCEALNNIVEERQLQSSFMLIIITHDEEFIQSLGKIRSYQKVARNTEGKSIVRKVRVS